MTIRLLIIQRVSQTHYINNIMIKKYFSCVSFLVLCSLAAPSFSATQTLLSTAEAISQVKRTVDKEKLVDRPACVDYFYSGKATPHVVIIKVVEKHDSICGGDPGVAPRLFSVYVDLQNHQMASDKDDPADGTLTMLPLPK